MEKEYYVYAWYFKSTGKIFHIGKGKGNRYKEIKQSRNVYFKNIISKYSDDVAVKKLYENLTNQEACNLERQLIKEYKNKGECETNFHEGGCGGNTGNYNSPSRHEKLSRFAKSRVGELNSNYGNHWTTEQKANLSKKIKEAWKKPEVREKFLKNRDYSKGSWNKGTHGLQQAWNKGLQMTEEHYKNMMNVDCKFKYEVYFENKLIYWCLGTKLLFKFCKEQFNISRTIVNELILEKWKPKFEKHKYLDSLKIVKLSRSVSTNRDECNDVEWRLQPFEVHGNSNN